MIAKPGKIIKPVSAIPTTFFIGYGHTDAIIVSG
jgi:hypothetical protein